MAEEQVLGVTSEVAELKKILLHRPGSEVETLTPNTLHDSLFEDIPWLAALQAEHDDFADTLRREGVQVYYYKDLLEDVFRDGDLSKSVAEHVIASGRGDDSNKDFLLEKLISMTPNELASTLIEGLHKSTVHPLTRDKNHLSWWIRDDFPFYCAPLPNLYFTRDPGTVIGDGLVLASTSMPARVRESWLLDIIRTHHPMFSSLQEEPLYPLHMGDNLECGDILVLSEKAIAVGASIRSSADAIQTLAQRLFSNNSGIREVLVIQIPNSRAYIHLDTVLTMVDSDSFVMFPGISGAIRVFRLTPYGQDVRIREEDSLKMALASVLGLPSVRIITYNSTDNIRNADADRINWGAIQREQWNDGFNTLAIRPGTVVVYKRNTVSNRMLEDAGIQVLPIAGSELVRGRGGPRCMSMPLLRV